MGGKLTEGKRWPRAKIREVLIGLVPKILPYCRRVKVCGSWRRGRPDCGDVDIVVLPFGQSNRSLLFNNFAELCGKSKEEMSKLCSLSFILDDVQVDIEVATEEDWGTQLMMWTGPANLNIRQRMKTKAKGWRLNQYGVFNKKGKNLATGMSEKEVYHLIGWKWLEPEGR